MYYRQLTENDVLNFEDVSNSDILSAFASIKKVNEQRKEERYVHAPEMEGGEQEQPQQQEVYEPGFNSKFCGLKNMHCTKIKCWHRIFFLLKICFSHFILNIFLEQFNLVTFQRKFFVLNTYFFHNLQDTSLYRDNKIMFINFLKSSKHQIEFILKGFILKLTDTNSLISSSLWKMLKTKTKAEIYFLVFFFPSKISPWKWNKNYCSSFL